MAGSQTDRSSCGRRSATERPSAASCVQTTTEQAAPTITDVPMCRHGHPITDGCDIGRQLWQLNRMMEEQTRILAQLLQTTQDQRQ